MKWICALLLLISVSYVLSIDETEHSGQQREIIPQPAEEHSNCGDVEGDENRKGKTSVRLCKKSLKSSRVKHDKRKERSPAQLEEILPVPEIPQQTIDESDVPKRKNRPPPTNCDIPSRRHGSRLSASNSRNLCAETTSNTNKEDVETLRSQHETVGIHHQAQRQKHIPAFDEDEDDREVETDDEVREEQEQSRFEFRRTNLQKKFPNIKFALGKNSDDGSVGSENVKPEQRGQLRQSSHERVDVI